MINPWFFLSSDEECDEECPQRLKKSIRDSSNPLELPEERFMKLFRINKDAFKYLLDQMQPHFKKVVRSSSIPNYIKITAALRFFAEGGFQKGVGEDWNVGLSQQSMSTILNEVLDIFEANLCPEWIKFPCVTEQKKAIKKKFFEKHRFPNVIGCIDGTHVRIIAPKEDEHLFFNRKGYHSLNVMVICDSEMRIRAIDAKYGGAAHDAHVWELSTVRQHMSENWNHGDRSFLLGDAGYPLEHWIIAPYRSSMEGSLQAQFNSLHSKCRSIVERVIGIWKARFKSIYRELHYTPKKSARIVNATAALHNICIHFNTELPDVSENSEENNEEYHASTEHNQANRIRDQIMNSLLL